MSNKECRFFPHLREQIIKVIRCRCAVPCTDALAGVDRVKQTEFTVIDELPLLTLFDTLDSQAHLLLYLVVRFIVEVGNTGVNTDNGLYSLKRVLTRLVRVIHVCFRNLDIFSKSSHKVNVFFSVCVDGGTDFQVLGDCFLK